MIYPSVEQLTKGKYNRYTLVMATAKCARMVTDEYIIQKERAERLIQNKETDKSLISLIEPELRDTKAVKVAIRRLDTGVYEIDSSNGEKDGKSE